MGTQTLRTLNEVIEEGISQVIAKGLIPTKVVLGKGEYQVFQNENRPKNRRNEQEGPVVVVAKAGAFTVFIVESDKQSEIRVEFENAGSLQV